MEGKTRTLLKRKRIRINLIPKLIKIRIVEKRCYSKGKGQITQRTFNRIRGLYAKRSG